MLPICGLLLALVFGSLFRQSVGFHNATSTPQLIAHWSLDGLLYVTLSVPHTGRYSVVIVQLLKHNRISNVVGWFMLADALRDVSALSFIVVVRICIVFVVVDIDDL